MWVVEGLTHRYPTKVLAELLPTCPQYCGHCTRMDLVGNSTPQVAKLKFDRQAGRPVCRDARLPAAHAPACATSSSPAATSPTCRGRTSRRSSTSCSTSRTSATSGSRPRRSWVCRSTGCADDVVEGVGRVSAKARSRGVSLAIHTHVNNAQSVTPLVAEAAKAMLDAGVRDVRNQGVLMRGVNDSTEQLLDLCFALQDGALDHAVLLLHVRHDPVHRALAALARRGPAPAALDHGLPARASRRRASSATCRSSASAGCTRSTAYDTERGMSFWRKNYRTSIEGDDTEALSREYVYYDPIYTLPEAGQQWWHASVDHESVLAEASQRAATSRAAAESQLVP